MHLKIGFFCFTILVLFLYCSQYQWKNKVKGAAAPDLVIWGDPRFPRD